MQTVLAAATARSAVKHLTEPVELRDLRAHRLGNHRRHQPRETGAAQDSEDVTRVPSPAGSRFRSHRADDRAKRDPRVRLIRGELVVGGHAAAERPLDPLRVDRAPGAGSMPEASNTVAIARPRCAPTRSVIGPSQVASRIASDQRRMPSRRANSAQTSRTGASIHTDVTTVTVAILMNRWPPKGCRSRRSVSTE